MNAYDYIDDYMEGSLNGDLLRQFESILSEDAELQLVVKNYKGVKQLSSGMLEMDLLDEVNAAGVAYNNVGESKGLLKKGIIFLVLSATIVVACIVIKNRFIDTVDSNSNKTFASLYQEPIWPVKRSSADTILQYAMYEFLQKDDIEAAKLLLQTDTLTDNIITNRYWISEMYLKKRRLDSTALYLPKAESMPIKAERIKVIESYLKEFR